MALTRLQEDLLQELGEQKKTIQKQLEIFEPLAGQLRKPAAHRLFSKGTLVILEIICYVLAAGAVAVAILADKIYPLSVWGDVRHNTVYVEELGMVNVQSYTIALYSILGLLAILFVIVARTLNSIRRKNDIINAVGKDIKILVGQHLERKASIHAIESRHFMDTKVADEAGRQNVTNIPNPGYDAPNP